MDGDRLTDIRFEGTGCAISTASASLMTEAVKGLSHTQIEALQSKVHALLTHTDYSERDSLGKLAALSGVAEYPARVKCATLAWHTLMQALQGGSTPVQTE
jgi:nitrogen fixation NifU-like protein